MIEWIRAQKSYPFPRSVYADLLSNDMRREFQQVNQTASYFFFRRVTLDTAIPATVVFRIQQDYYYHLYTLRFAWPATRQGGRSPELSYRLTQLNRNRDCTPDLSPVPVALMSTPGEFQPLRYAVPMNTTFHPSTFIQIQIAGGNGTDPQYVDILTEGTWIPREFYQEL